MREFFQIFTMLLSLGVCIGAIQNCKKFPSEKWYWMLYFVFGLLGMLFYLMIGFVGSLAHEYSALFRAVQSSIVLGVVLGVRYGRR